MAKRIVTPFGENGDRTAVQDDAQAGGLVNYDQGYPAQYSLDIQSDATARRINRNRFNQIMHDITSNVQEWQNQIYPDYITQASNGGVAFSYSQGVIVRFNDIYRVSLVNNNTTEPSNNSNWANAFPWPVNLGGTGAINSDAARTNLGIVQASTTQSGIVELANNTETASGTDASRSVTPVSLLWAINNSGTLRTALITWLRTNLASTSLRGVVELATQNEVNLGTDAARVITPATLVGRTATLSRLGVIQLASQAEVDAGTNSVRAVTPETLSESPQVAKSWVRFNGVGSISISASHNISSVTDQGVGLYFANFANSVSGSGTAVASTNAGEARVGGISTAGVTIQSRDPAGAVIDASFISMVSFAS